MTETTTPPYRCPHCQGDGDTCTHCNGTGDRLLGSLDRIATALEVIGLHLTGQRERERAALLSQLAYLDRGAERARETFSRIDDRLGQMYGVAIDHHEVAQVQQQQVEAGRRVVATADAVTAFCAAHPEIAAEYDANRPAVRS